jgi:hypothetical protein
MAAPARAPDPAPMAAPLAVLITWVDPQPASDRAAADTIRTLRMTLLLKTRLQGIVGNQG